jgi:hypothetical protein
MLVRDFVQCVNNTGNAVRRGDALGHRLYRQQKVSDAASSLQHVASS